MKTAYVICILICCVSSAKSAQNVSINGSIEGRVFDGIGAVSAGASSRLLIDYPEPMRSDILDFLFKPNFGAGFQHLKVEIGGGFNSTDGTEATHARTMLEMTNPAPEYYNRGYEWWLMEQAKLHNSAIYLDALAWVAPAWIGSDQIYGSNYADYTVAFVKGAKDYHNLTLDDIGIWNERNTDPAQKIARVGYIKLLRQRLNAAGFSGTKIVATDSVRDWSIADTMVTDPTLASAVGAINTHYPYKPPMDYNSSANAKATGKPLYSSEDGAWTGEWTGACQIARSANRNYINGKMTRIELWSPVTSYYDILRIPGSGVMYANTPWSGYFNVQPATWAVAHYTQFIQPGWKYIDSGCGFLTSQGSYVTLKKPDGSGNYSIIVETVDATVSQPVTFTLSGGLSSAVVRVWRSNSTSQFVQLSNITPSGNSFTITLDPGSIYSLTTTTGQTKGSRTAPAKAAFPLPYSDNFEGYAVGTEAKYFSDQDGTFEVVQRSDGNGKAMRQVVTEIGITWISPGFSPNTFLGSSAWRNYTVSCDAMIENAGSAMIYGRVLRLRDNGLPPWGYWLSVNSTGNWSLNSYQAIIGSGNINFPANVWHTLKLDFEYATIKAYIDNVLVTTVTDATYANGMAGIGSGWNYAQFDNFTLTPGALGGTNLALYKPITASSIWSDAYTADKANDGEFGTRWNSGVGSTTGEWLAIDFGATTRFNNTYITQYAPQTRVTGYKIQYWGWNKFDDNNSGRVDFTDFVAFTKTWLRPHTRFDTNGNGTVDMVDFSQFAKDWLKTGSANTWMDAYVGGTLGTTGKSDTFPAISSNKIRFYVTGNTQSTSLYEFEVYKDSSSD